MRNYTRAFLLLFFVYFVFCGVKQPVLFNNSITDSGTIFITSNVNPATIFLDGIDTGHVTPDTLKTITVGSHTIRVFKDGYFANPESLAVNIRKDEITTASFTLEEIIQQGFIFIDSEPAGAEILVDGVHSGKTTPDTITVSTGSHQLSLHKNGYHVYLLPLVQVSENITINFDNIELSIKPQIFIEAFANTSCLPCTTASQNLHNLEQIFNPDDFTIMEYFSNWPNPQDIFYLNNPTDNFARIMYYKITTVPSVFIAGKSVDPLDLSQIEDTYSSLAGQANQDIGLCLTKQPGDSLKILVEITAQNVLPDDDLRLFVAVMEDDIHFDSPPGSNGLKQFTHVFRTFLTANTGEKIVWDDNHFQTECSAAISSSWNPEKLTVVGFIQNRQTNQIIQSSRL